MQRLLAQGQPAVFGREEHRAHASDASRTPLKICRRCGRSQFRNVTRATSGSLAHEPPRSTRCSSPFTGYPGFEAFPYAEYSEVFFGDEQRVLRGGSWATDPLVARVTFRNWDFPQRRQLFSGVRLASDA